MTPELEDRVCLTATLADSYQAAAALSAKWGSPVDASTIRQHACAVCQRAAAQAQTRGDAPPPAVAPPAGVKAVGPAALVIMMDGWLARQRGEDWGAAAAVAAPERVAWHEIKGAVIYRLEQAGQTAGGRGVIAQKYVVAWQDEPLAFGRRVQAEARRRGLGQAPRVYVVADGGVWIWNIVMDRFAAATGVLDFYHASQHLWELAHSLHPDNEAEAKAWVEPLLHQLRHGGEASVLQTLQNLPGWCAQREQPLPPTAAKEINYFENHRAHIQYEARAAEGCPVGSGAMESLCGQLQGRFKRGGQFWTEPGRRRLMALEVARRNHDWNEVWSLN